jgi:hypothetical protein
MLRRRLHQTHFKVHLAPRNECASLSASTSHCEIRALHFKKVLTLAGVYAFIAFTSWQLCDFPDSPLCWESCLPLDRGAWDQQVYPYTPPHKCLLRIHCQNVWQRKRWPARKIALRWCCLTSCHPRLTRVTSFAHLTSSSAALFSPLLFLSYISVDALER